MKVLFFGDSITEQAIKPGGFILQIDRMVKQSPLSDDVQLMGAGISGDKVYDLYLRLETDVLQKDPDIVFIFIGINDVGHKLSRHTGTDADKFEKFYRAIIEKVRKKNITIILCTPTVLGEKNDGANELDEDLNTYSNIIRTLSRNYSLPLCDLRKTFTAYLKTNNLSNQEKGILTEDRLHLNATGNLVVANAMWNTLQPLLK